MTSLLLIAHGSRRAEANADLEDVAEQLRARGHPDVQPSYLELAEPSIEGGGALCAGRGATRVVMLPYFLSPGKHVVEDLTAARDRLAAAFPTVTFALAAPFAGHPGLVAILEERALAAGMRDEG